MATRSLNPGAIETLSTVAWPTCVPLTEIVTSAKGTVAEYGVGFVKFIVASNVNDFSVLWTIFKSSTRGLKVL